MVSAITRSLMVLRSSLPLKLKGDLAREADASGPTVSSLQRPAPEATRWPLQCATLSRHDPLSSARNRCTVTHYHNQARTEESRFRGALDDVIIIPLVFVALAANKILHFILSILMRLLDYAFPFAVQIVWLPLFAARVLGNVAVTVL